MRSDLLVGEKSVATGFHSVPEILDELRAGRAVVVVDDENRENEGDLICAAQFASPEMINFMATHARGLICLAMTAERLDQLQLPLMVSENTDRNQTAFTVSIDAGPHLGVSTGISAADRAKTIQAAIDARTRAGDLTRPGHIFPIRAREGGVLKRAGHTEAAVDLARMAGLYPAGVICEIQNPDGSMSRLPELLQYARTFNLKIVTIAEIIAYRLQNERFIKRETVAMLPTAFGKFEIFAYRDTLDGKEHVALVRRPPAGSGLFDGAPPFAGSEEPVLVRVHSECLTGDTFGSLRCDCRQQLQAALKMIDHHGQGVVVYLRQEGRGIGLINKLKAYALQDMGLDTVEANERLGFAADLRSYGVGAQILNDLGVHRMKLITNNPRKIAGLSGYNLAVVDRVPLIIEETDYNSTYLNTKAQKLGHLLPGVRLLTLGVLWRQTTMQPYDPERSNQVELLRELFGQQDLLIQEERRPVASAVFGPDAVVVHIGLPAAGQNPNAWYTDPTSACRRTILAALEELVQNNPPQVLQFLVSSGADPLNHLSERLQHREEDLASLPDTIKGPLSPETVYIFKAPAA
ncbi:bifunctional 3,4-dihydroxy-2-butanone-4-phosphate synthase RibB/GTP cyclohydrolase II RibA [Gloeobacter morelensis MG652769]|uniref:Riboflavin biosynthesis protein RibBA n=1 Tax=Gloeobacter morelensis MG652769 TaxID=2781736 RepID=A0ABY3PGG6_9CYAN|nr:bifunctional 3,4-dihydroxy-2-butanone-4-phosphate synthase RibB/GTP cyclohydrolase II RibA [Gloeobacter morelensis MG652769]